MMNKKLSYFLIPGYFLKQSVNGMVTETVRGLLNLIDHPYNLVLLGIN